MGATLPQIHLFEMRRLEMLSNTIFGVAMTLLAYDLPKASSFKQAPSWIDWLHVYAQPVIALMISFVVAGLFWFSHHRRLAVAPEAGRGMVFLNLFFLLAIIILPVTNGLYGSYRLDGVVAVIYGLHLSMIAIAERVVVGSRAAGPPRSAIAGDGAVSGLRVRARHGHGPCRAESGAVHLVPGVPFAARRAGWPARRAEATSVATLRTFGSHLSNRLASSEIIRSIFS